MMKKIISAVLTVTMIMGATSVAFAQPKDKASKTAPAIVTTKVDAKTCATQRKDDEKKTEVKKPEFKEQDKKNEDKKNEVKKNEVKKDSQLDKSKQSLIKSCDDMIAQITKLKGYIISKEGKFLVEFKDQATGDAVLKSIDEAINKINDFKKRINAATDSKVLKDLKKEIENNFIKHQTIVKRITGLTNAARLKTAYDETKALVDKLGAGINAITTNASITLDVEALKKAHKNITAELEEARLDYLDAVAMFSSITDSTKADKSFKEAQAKLMEAKDGIHDALIETKQLLVKIKTGVHKEIGAIKIDVDDDDDKDDDHDHDKDHDDEDDD